jgi:hypothetical protein
VSLAAAACGSDAAAVVSLGGSPVNVYTPGTTVLMNVSFVDPTSGAPVTPEAVTLRVLDPTLTETDQTGTLSNPSPGVYAGSVAAVASGLWRYRFEATGAAEAAFEGRFTVAQTLFASPA